MKTKVEIGLPMGTDPGLPKDGDLFYDPSDPCSVYRLTYVGGAWSTFKIGDSHSWFANCTTQIGATSGLTPVPPGSVITIRVEE